MSSSTTNEDERLIRIKEVKYMVGFSTSKIYDLIAKGKFPEQHKIGGSAVWKLSEVKEYMSRVTQRAS
jgi:predicted DNA-binding transcriptional regulator AlpA